MMEPTIDNSDELPLVMRVRHMQEYLDISRPAAYELAHQEGFPAIRIGRTIRVPRDAFFKWLEAQAGDHHDAQGTAMRRTPST